MPSYQTTIFLGHDLALFLPEPNTKWEIEIKHTLEVAIEEGRTGRENRYGTHEEIRHELKANFTAPKAIAEELESALWNLTTEFIGVPLFIDAMSVANWGDLVYDAAYVLNYDTTGFAIYASDDIPEEPDYEMLAPLFVGRLKSRPRLTALTQGDAQYSLTILERSPWDFRISPAAQAVGDSWPALLVENVRQLPETWTDDIIEYQTIGDGRVEAVAHDEGVNRRRQKLLFTLSNRTEIRTLLNFFKARGGRRESFVVPWAFRPSDADAAATPHSTTVRFATDSLTLRYKHASLASVSIEFVQLPWELEAVEGETPEQSPRVYFYRFTLDVPDTPVVWRYTNYGKPLTRADDGEYVTAPIEHDAITQTIDLQDSSVKLVTWIFAGNPLVKVAQRRYDTPLQVEIFEGSPTAPSDAEIVYSGSIGSPELNGRRFDVPTTLLGGLLETKVPGFMFSERCNHEFCQAGCNLDPDDWTFDGTADSTDGLDLTLTVTENPPAADLVADYFAKGWVKKGTGEDYEVRQVVRSTPGVGSVQVFTLKRAFRTLDEDEPLTFRPYCEGTRAECQDKFDNYINNGSHPHIGPKNISLPQVNTSQQNTGKK